MSEDGILIKGELDWAHRDSVVGRDGRPDPHPTLSLALLTVQTNGHDIFHKQALWGTFGPVGRVQLEIEPMHFS